MIRKISDPSDMIQCEPKQTCGEIQTAGCSCVARQGDLAVLLTFFDVFCNEFALFAFSIFFLNFRRVEFPLFFNWFHCYLGKVKEENNASSCLGPAMAGTTFVP